MTATVARPGSGSVPAPAHSRGVVVPAWVETGNGALAVQVHTPYGVECRGAVILLPPFGRTERTMRPGLRALADRLARRDCVVLRADWSGTAESAAPLADAPAVPAMARRLADVAALATYAQRVLHQGDLTLVGAGLGATLAALALGDPQGPRPDGEGRTPYRSLVLLDPHPGHEPWIRLPQARAAAARGTRILLVGREDVPLESEVEAYAARIAADRFDAIDLDALDATATEPVIPDEAWDIITDWLAPHTRRPTPVPAVMAGGATRVADGVREEYVEIGGLPGVLTIPDEVRHALLLIPSDGEHRGGPGGDGWVRLARAAARSGVATLRVDRTGSGEARAADDTRPEARMISPASVADHVAAVEWLTARTGLTPAIVGNGAGAWTALTVAGKVPVARVVSVGQREWSTDPMAAGELRPWVFAHAPYLLIARLGRTRALATPQPLLEAATRLGAAVDIYGDEDDAAVFGAARGLEALTRLARRGAQVTRFTERSRFDVRRPEALELALGRVLGRLLRDVPGLDDAGDVDAAGVLAEPVAYATVGAPPASAASAPRDERSGAEARVGGRRGTPGYAPA